MNEFRAHVYRHRVAQVRRFHQQSKKPIDWHVGVYDPVLVVLHPANDNEEAQGGADGVSGAH